MKRLDNLAGLTSISFDMDIQEIHRYLAKSDDAPLPLRVLVIVSSSFVFQGWGYMDSSERAFKAATEVGLTTIFVMVLRQLLGTRLAFFVAIPISHLMNWIGNGQLPTALKHFGFIQNDMEEFRRWTKYISHLSRESEAVAAAVAYGSLSRGTLSETSDLDVRIIRRDGAWNGVRGALLVAWLRFLGTIKLFPIDIFLLDGTDSLDRLRDDESPVLLSDKDGLFQDVESKEPIF